MTPGPILPLSAADAQGRIAAALEGMLREGPAPDIVSAPQAADPLAAAVRTALQTAATSQGGLSQLLADLASTLRRTDLPEAARAAVANLLALRTPLHPALTATDIRRAVQVSGLFLESELAAAPRSEPPPAPAAAQTPPDMKAALLGVRRELEAWKPPLPDARSAPQDAPGHAGREATPPPPYRGAPTAAQRPAAPSLPADAPAEVLAGRLISETRAAVARQELHQLASLPEARGAERPDEARGPRWLFEIPFSTPQGAAIAQFEVGRDAHGGGAAAEAAQWRLRFSLDVEPLGPVHAQVTLGGQGKAAVTLWAEREACADRLREQAAMLKLALQDAAFPAEVTVYSGAPRRAAPPAGALVDRSS